MRDKYTLGQVIKTFQGRLEKKSLLSSHQQNVLRALVQCRTSALGGHVDVCPSCGTVEVSYNSCRNRHCPLCQGTAREKWVAARKRDVLPIKYFHVVFTLPDTLNPLLLRWKKELYSHLFKTAWQTLDKFFRNKDIQGGMIALLHTWGSNLQFHPHLHCIVPAGGMDEKRQWRKLPGAENETPYLFPVKAMSKVFRAKYLAGIPPGISICGCLRKKLIENDWVVHCKRPMKVGQVIEYLGRYSHRAAITNRRLLDVNEQTVRFSYKDYKKGGMLQEMELAGEEFLRRFCLHILPSGFVRIRHYGVLASCNKSKREELRQQTNDKNGVIDPEQEEERIELEETEHRPNSFLCPHCNAAYMVCVKTIPSAARSPPFTQLIFN